MIAIFDGAMGTMLQQAGLPAGSCPEEWNISHPAAVTAIHQQYVAAGATIIETNTFGANRLKLSHYGLAEQVAAINQAAVQAAKAAGPAVKIAGSVGSTGKLLTPLGELSFSDAYTVFCEQIRALSAAGVDYILIETIIDIQEMRAALLAAKDTSNLPVICQMSFGADGRTVTGTDPATAALLLDAMGADVIGANCSLGPEQLLPIVEQMAAVTTKPLSVQPNAGMPQLIDGQTVFPMSPDEMAVWAPRLIAAGASFLGGCCGTTPAHIAALKAAAAELTPPPRTLAAPPGSVALTSRSRTVWLGANQPLVSIGERINPTGRKQLAADIREGRFLSVKQEALGQVEAGAQVLDINMGVPGLDQAAAMRTAIEELSMLVDVPLSIDTTDAAALEAGLQAYPGRALINSVSAEPERLESFLPLAKRYGAAILCLPITPDGVPQTAAERLAAIELIITAAQAVGLRNEDFILDALVLTVAAEPSAAQEALRTLRLYREQLGYPTTMGLSNISYGLPQRPLINANFAAMAFAAGLDAPILNPYDQRLTETVAAAAVLLGKDPSGQAFSQRHAAVTPPAAAVPSSPAGDPLSRIRSSVVHGEKEGVVSLVKTALQAGHSALTITEQGLTAAMNEIGEAFGQGRCFLPQVLLAAETMRAAFITLKEELPGETQQSLGTVLLATVKGDIHDLGKNIVAALMENNGFRVIDLGKDVTPEAIAAAALEHQADIVGLCALMTTTMPQIDATIAALKAANVTAHTMVGGAVLTAEYAAQAGADSYAQDGVAAVSIAKQWQKDQAD